METLLQILNKLKNDKKTNGQTLGNLIKKIDKNLFEWQTQLNEMTTFLNTNSTIGQRLYHIWFNENKIPKCPYCDSALKFNDKGKFSLDKTAYHGNYKFTCGSKECESKFISEVKKKVQKEIRKKPEKIKSRSEKLRTNKLKVYGNAISKAQIIKKSEETSMKNHGVKNGAQSQQAKETTKKLMLERYGVEHYLQSTDAKIKTEKFYSNLGVTHNTHIPSIFDKMIRRGYKKKDYIFPSGKIVKVQGYEHMAIDRLLSEGLKDDDIVIGIKEIETHVGIVWYFTEDGKKHRYYPDIYIKSLNRILEVKSTYTFTQDGIKNELKKQACLKLGFDFEFDVYDRNKNKVKV